MKLFVCHEGFNKREHLTVEPLTTFWNSCVLKVFFLMFLFLDKGKYFVGVQIIIQNSVPHLDAINKSQSVNVLFDDAEEIEVVKTWLK